MGATGKTENITTRTHVRRRDSEQQESATVALHETVPRFAGRDGASREIRLDRIPMHSKQLPL